MAVNEVGRHPGGLSRRIAALRPKLGIRRRLGAARQALWWLTGEGRHHRRRLAGLRGAYAGRRCWVLGNGPSLLKTDVRLLKDEITIGSNALFLIYDQMGYQPTFLTVEDPLVAEDRAAALNALQGSRKIFPHDLSRFLKPDADTTYCNFVRIYPGFPRFSSAFERIVYWGGTVSMMNLQLAYHLGCNPIYLVGFDHNYRVPANLASHVITSEADDVNHVHPEYFGRGYRWHDPVVSRMEAGYRVARAFCDARGVRVLNATAGGKLEVFERIPFESALAHPA